MVIFLSAKNKMNILNLSMFVYVVVFQILILPKFLNISDLLSASFIVIMATLAYIFFGFRRKFIDVFSKNLIIKSISFVLIYFIVIYGLGIFIKIGKNPYSMVLPLLIKNSICPLIIILAMEIYRYIVVNSTNNKRMIAFYTIGLIVFETFISVKISNFDNLFSIFNYSTTIVIPIIIKNIVLSILSKNGGIIPCIIYRIPIELYIFFIPVLPDLSNYLVSMIGVSFPLILYMMIYSDIVEREDKNSNKIDSSMLKPRNPIVDFVGLVLISIVISLVSGFFPYTLIAVGSNSMAPYVYSGDAVIYKKVRDKDDIKVNDVIVYNNKDINHYVIHRLIKIEEKDGKQVYITKGDSNHNKDNITIVYKDIKGVVKTKIRYIGYPTLIFMKLIRKEV